MKKCPYCAEEIQDDSTYCSYCGRSPLIERKAGSPKKEDHIRKRPSYWGTLTLILAIFGIIVLAPKVWKRATVDMSSDNLTEVVPTPTATYHIVNYRPVTWNQLENFIVNDPTDHDANDKYNPDYNNCLDFSMRLVENAHKQNIEAWIVGVYFYNETNGHAFVAFETIDKGIVYIEPQSDSRYLALVKGGPLCDASGENSCTKEIVERYKYLQCDQSRKCTSYSPSFASSQPNAVIWLSSTTIPGSCYNWEQITVTMERQKVCVEGKIAQVYSIPGSAQTRINFTTTPNTFFLVSTNFEFYYLQPNGTHLSLAPGDCVRATEVVKVFDDGRHRIPYMLISDLQRCGQ